MGKTNTQVGMMHLLIKKIMFVLLILLPLLQVAAVADRIPQPVPIIFDTDMGNDIDDALALAMAHGLVNRGECHILGVTISKDNLHAAEFTSVLNTFYGRPDIPIGLVQNGVTPDDGQYAAFVSAKKDTDGSLVYPRAVDIQKKPASAVAMLRNILSKQPDESVVLVMTGFSTNMARLLQSGPDMYSEQTGKELVSSKVNRVYMMAGDFRENSLKNPEQGKIEYNIQKDIPSAQYFVEHCPVPILFSGFEVGRKILFPADSIQNGLASTQPHPLKDAYGRFEKMPYDRPCWDLTVMLAAVRPDESYFERSASGTVIVQDNGRVRFCRDDGGRHRYLILPDNQREIIRRVFIDLVEYADKNA